MYKHILLAVLIGLAAAAEKKHTVASYSESATVFDIKYFMKLSYDYEFDVYWGTGYDGGVYINNAGTNNYYDPTANDAGVAVPSSGWNFEEYYMMFNSFAQAGVTIEFFNAYEITLSAWFEPWTWYPIDFWAIWYRPIASNFNFSDFDLNLYLGSFFECLKVYLAREEHSKIAVKSFLDFFENISGYTPVPISSSDWKFWSA